MRSVLLNGPLGGVTSGLRHLECGPSRRDRKVQSRDNQTTPQTPFAGSRSTSRRWDLRTSPIQSGGSESRLLPAPGRFSRGSSFGVCGRMTSWSSGGNCCFACALCDRDHRARRWRTRTAGGGGGPQRGPAHRGVTSRGAWQRSALLRCPSRGSLYPGSWTPRGGSTSPG